MASKGKIRALDTVFSKYIRMRDLNGDSYAPCCSCGKMVAYDEADAGHFINRRWMAIRWDERNVHLQCRSCNRFDEGNNVGYTRYMMRRYGDTVIDILIASKVGHSWKDFELDILIREYKDKLKGLTS